ncbi:MAG: zinc metallopeptidase [Actinomycetia bacterium]|nr:zinc metallopeptidase [Actinomycetes bacterium]
MYFLDPAYFIIVLPAVLFAFYAQATVSSTIARASRIRAGVGLTGREVAERILRANGIGDVEVRRIGGWGLGDHYDPRSRTVNLSPKVYDQASVAAVGIAAHEAGHAVQHARGYAFLLVRNGLFPVVQFGSQLALPLFIAGLVFASGSRLGLWLMDLGIVLFFGAVLFQIITLPVEYNASARAVASLGSLGLVDRDEQAVVRQVLSAAALTYVAATAAALAQFIYLLTLRGRRD